MNYFYHIVIMFEIYFLLALSANQIMGNSGLFSLAQAVFYGVGAYTTAICATKLNINYGLILLIVIINSVLISLLYNYIATKVREFFFSVATLALQIMVFSIMYNWYGVTNGSYGISGISTPKIGGLQINNIYEFCILYSVMLAIVYLIYKQFLKTPISNLIKATRDDQIAILSLGKSPKYYKRISIAISAIMAGIAGSMYASYSSYIDPTSFTFDESVLIVSIVLIGGIATIKGSFFGVLIYILIPEILKFIQLPDSIAANTRMIIFGIILILIIRFKPKGIFGKYLIQ